MSVDLSLHLFFPVEEATPILRDLAAMIVAPPFLDEPAPRKGSKAKAKPQAPATPKVVTVVAPDGFEAPIPYEMGFFRAGQATVPLDGLSCDVLIDPSGRRDWCAAEENAIFPVNVSLALGRAFLSARIGSIASGMIHLMLDGTEFAARMADLMARHRRAAAAFEGMGEWSWFGGPGGSFDLPDDVDTEDADALAGALIALKADSP